MSNIMIAAVLLIMSFAMFAMLPLYLWAKLVQKFFGYGKVGFFVFMAGVGLTVAASCAMIIYGRF